MKSKIAAWFLGIFLFVANPVKGIAQTEPVVLGRAVERLQVGKLLHRDDFDSLERWVVQIEDCLLYTSPSPRDRTRSRMPSSA